MPRAGTLRQAGDSKPRANFRFLDVRVLETFQISSVLEELGVEEIGLDKFLGFVNFHGRGIMMIS